MAAIAGDKRPETAFGQALARGVDATEAAKTAGAYIEGAAIARRIADWADRNKVTVPISTAIAKLMTREASGAQVMQELMTRPMGTEE